MHGTLPNNATAASDALESGSRVEDLFSNFKAISLEQTNSLAQMLSRIDNKYVVNFHQFQAFLEAMQERYSVLEIARMRQFDYRSCYYDDDFGCYLDHHQGRRQRFKVRTREYVNSGDKFFEIKLKGLRGLTAKHRIGCDFLVSPNIEGDCLDTLCGKYRQQYKKNMPYTLRPALLVNYKRCTLVARAGGERVTIDHALSFGCPDGNGTPVRIGDDFIIIETKSAEGKGYADRTLKNLQIRKASKCSKYCIGVNLIGAVTKNNHFLPTIRQVQKNIVSESRRL